MMRSGRRKKSCGGQVLAEYALMLAMFAAVSAVLLFLLAVFSDFSWRVLALIAWEPFS